MMGGYNQPDPRQGYGNYGNYKNTPIILIKNPLILNINIKLKLISFDFKLLFVNMTHLLESLKFFP